jgi:small subunit ribosomal protein S17e
MDFQTNKKICEEIAIIPSKRLRNKIAGFVTHLMKRIQKGTVRGISLKLQEEERERRMDYVPEVSLVDEIIQNGIHVDDEVHSMLQSIGFGGLENVTKVQTPQQPQGGKGRARKSEKQT